MQHSVIQLDLLTASVGDCYPPRQTTFCVPKALLLYNFLKLSFLGECKQYGPVLILGFCLSELTKLIHFASQNSFDKMKITRFWKRVYRPKVVKYNLLGGKFKWNVSTVFRDHADCSLGAVYDSWLIPESFLVCSAFLDLTIALAFVQSFKCFELCRKSLPKTLLPITLFVTLKQRLW